MRRALLLKIAAAVLAVIVAGAIIRAPIQEAIHRHQESQLLQERIKGRLLRLYVESPALHRGNKVFVYLPPSYATSRERYPVLYLLHGMPGASRDWFVKGRAHETAERLILEGRIKPIILVSADAFGPGGPKDRTEYLNSPSRSLFVENYFAYELPRFIDSKFRTRPDARARALVGLSAGGYGAMNIGAKHPDRFRILCSHSGFFRPQTEHSYFENMLGPPGPAWDANDPLKRARDGWIDRRLHVCLDVGRSDSLLGQNREFAQALARYHVDSVFRVVEGGHHWSLWQRQFKDSLEFVDARVRELSDAGSCGKPTGLFRNRR